MFLGLDLGTSSFKAMLADAQGRVIARASHPYPLLRPRPGWAEQRPDDWWQAVTGTLAALRAQGAPLERALGIGLSGQMHGLVLLDGAGQPLTPCQTWADTRCEAEASEIGRLFPLDRLRALAGSPASTSATAAKLLWVRRHEQEVFAAARTMLLPKDYLRLRLTGTLATDPSDASGTLLCDVGRRDWSDDMLAALAIPRELLPPVFESQTVIGSLLPEVAEELGLPVGVPVVAGGGDAECAAVGLGIIGSEDAALVSLGTAGQFFAATRQPLYDPSGRLQTLCHAVPERWHVMHAILAGASALDWLTQTLAAPGGSAPAVAALLSEAVNEPPGARGLLFLPHLNGVRLPEPDAAVAGAFIGLRPDVRRAALARAVVEGAALALRDGLDAAHDLGMEISRVRLAGGARRHPLWAYVLASVFGLPIELSATEDASALGAALLAAVGTGADVSLESVASRLAEPETVIQPDVTTVARYNALAQVYRQADRQLRETFRGLAELRELD